MSDYQSVMPKYTGAAEQFRFPFPGIEKIKQNYSQAMQDIFVLAALHGKHNGTWLEIGAFHPVYDSNTYLLEQHFGWSGISIEREPSRAQAFIGTRPKTDIIIADATSIDYSALLRGLDMRIDYLSLDVEPAEQTFAVLLKLQSAPHRFSVITYEHDFYAHPTKNAHVRTLSRQIMDRGGYILVAGNVCINGTREAFEDWYLDGIYFDADTIRKFKRDSDTPISCATYLATAGT